MKKKAIGFIGIVLAVVMMFGLAAPAMAASVTDFTDVKPTDWYYDAVNHATSIGLFAGTSATTFSPNTTMSRGMFITVLGRLAGVPDSYGRTKTTPFNDVTQADYFFPYVAWANDNGFDTGVVGGSFAPKADIPREHMAVIFYRYAVKNGYDLTYSTEKYNTFPDTASVSPYAVTALQWATSHGIINGDGGKLRPTDTATRAQVAQIYLNFSRLESSAPDVPDPPAQPADPGKPDTPGGADWENYNPVYTPPTGKSAPDASGGYYDYDLAAEIMKQVDALRVANGANTLAFHPKIQGWAAIRAQEQTILEGHTRPDGNKFYSVGIGLTSENITILFNCSKTQLADISAIAEWAVNNWFTSTKGHKEAMLSPASNLGAVACYVQGSTVNIVHLFSNRTLYFMDYLIP